MICILLACCDGAVIWCILVYYPSIKQFWRHGRIGRILIFKWPELKVGPIGPKKTKNKTRFRFSFCFLPPNGKKRIIENKNAIMKRHFEQKRDFKIKKRSFTRGWILYIFLNEADTSQRGLNRLGQRYYHVRHGLSFLFSVRPIGGRDRVLVFDHSSLPDSSSGRKCRVSVNTVHFFEKYYRGVDLWLNWSRPIESD